MRCVAADLECVLSAVLFTNLQRENIIFFFLRDFNLDLIYSTPLLNTDSHLALRIWHHAISLKNKRKVEMCRDLVGSSPTGSICLRDVSWRVDKSFFLP